MKLAQRVTVLVMLAISGCGANVDPRRPVHGQVTVDSTGVERGSISFLPTGETIGPAATTAIVEGQYIFTRANGPFPGTYRVTVGVIALESGQGESSVVGNALDGSARAKTGLRSEPHANAGKDGAGQGKSRQWDAECVIKADGDDLQNFDFVAASP